MTTQSKLPIGVGGLVAIGAVALLLIVGISNWLNAANTGAEQEAGLQATYDNNRTILANYSNTIGDMAQIPAIQRDNLNSVLETAFSARYGEEGSQAAIQFITEAYPGTLDNALYTNIQNAIQAGRTQFQQNQTTLLDKKRVYQIMLTKPISGFWLGLAGYPKTDLSQFKVVTNGYSDRAFETGREEGLSINNPAPRPTAPATAPAQ